MGGAFGFSFVVIMQSAKTIGTCKVGSVRQTFKGVQMTPPK